MAIELVMDKKAEKNYWLLSGDLTVFSLSKNVKTWIKQFPMEGPWIISGEKISKIDTAGLAFLLECLAHAKNNHIALRFSSLPLAVVPLMTAQGVGDLINAHVDQ